MRKKSFLICFLSLLCLNMNGCKQEDGNKDSLIVATYSVRAQPIDFSVKQRELLEGYNVDVAALQVIDRYTDRNNYDMCKIFNQDPFQYIYFSKAMNFARGEYGIMTVAKIPFISVEQNQNITNYNNNEDLNKELLRVLEVYNYDDKELKKRRDALYDAGAVEPRVYQRVLLKINEKEVAFYNIHLSHENSQLRLLQLEQMKQVLDEDPCIYKIMAGTFNTDQKTEELDLFFKDYQIANGIKGQWLNTYPLDDDEDMRIYSIDNIICSKNMKIEQVKMVPSNLSNHNPLIVKVTLN